MDGLWFAQALERVSASQADLARHLQLAPSAVSRMLRGARQMKPLEIAHTASFLGVPQDEVLRHVLESASSMQAGDVPRPGRGRPPSSGSSPPPAPSTALALASDQIPVKSGTRGNTDQEMFLEEGPIGYTSRPANLDGIRSAYAIYMVGDSMEPRYEPGWLLHVNPFKPPTRGRDVVVYKKEQAVMIKQFVGWEGDTLVLRQLHPEAVLRISRDQVLECHLIVGTDQEG